MKIIEEAIKEKFGSKAAFCRAAGVDPSNSTRFVRRIETRFLDLKEDLKDLGLELMLRKIGPPRRL